MKRLAAYLAAIALLVITGFFVATAGPLSSVSQLCTGGADEVFIDNNAREFSGDKAWVIDANLGCDNKIFGGGGTIAAEDISSDGVSALKDFSLGINNFEAWFSNPVIDDRENVYRVRMATYNCGFDGCGSNDQAKCDDFQAESPYTSQAETRRTAVTELYCFKVEKTGEAASFGLNQDSSFSATVQASADGRSDSDPISKDDPTASVNVGDVNRDGDSEEALVTWRGSFIGDTRSIDISPVKPVCDSNCERPTNNVDWIVGSQDLFTEWNQYDEGGFDQCVQNSNIDRLSDCVIRYNDRAANVFADSSRTIQDQTSIDIARVDVIGTELRMYTEKAELVERPDFRITVDADWIGFDTPVGRPVFQTPLPEIDIVGNSRTTADFQVLNDAAGGSHRIRVNLECPRPLSGGSTAKRVQAGISETFSVPIEIGATNTRTYTCDVEAFDTDDDSTRAIAQVTVNAQNSCPDQDEDGVCDQFDACPSVAGASTNGGCPTKEVCGDSIDNNGNGRVDEDCGTTGPAEVCGDEVDNDGDGFTDEGCSSSGFFAGIAEFLSGFGAVGEGLAALVGDVIAAFQNPFANTFLLIDIMVTLAAGLAAFILVSTQRLLPIDEFSELIQVDPALTRLATGGFAGVLTAAIVYGVFSNIFVKLVIVIAIGLWWYFGGVVTGVMKIAGRAA
ncbi:hypothetical protein G3I44_14370 [Halogeometricum borinquense]|uniref:Uncharacterized protein n=1 Tax=Halogeometricum borinquense TaxID=60847 RepID=A0A6C0ULX8_9EURY|nr:hypothetical protein [Halogeometricum borinquense]QIB75371.1 hypothetical protein G3I44_14370 [Halogeometricum borinquense]